MKTRTFNQHTIWMISIFLLHALLLSSCHSSNSQPTITITMLVEKVIPPTLQLTPTLIPTRNEMAETPTPSLTKKNTPTISLPGATNTPATCPPFELDTELPDPDLPENYIGRYFDHHNLPEGLETSGGSIVRDRDSQLELGISTFKWQEIRELYWLEKLVCRDKDGHAYFEIVDAFATPPLSGDETEPWVCFDDESEVYIVSGLGLYEKSVPVTIGDYRGWFFTDILFIYDIDFVSQKFIFLDPDGLVCLKDLGP